MYVDGVLVLVLVLVLVSTLQDSTPYHESESESESETELTKESRGTLVLVGRPCTSTTLLCMYSRCPTTPSNHLHGAPKPLIFPIPSLFTPYCQILLKRGYGNGIMSINYYTIVREEVTIYRYLVHKVHCQLKPPPADPGIEICVLELHDRQLWVVRFHSFRFAICQARLSQIPTY